MICETFKVSRGNFVDEMTRLIEIGYINFRAVRSSIFEENTKKSAQAHLCYDKKRSIPIDGRDIKNGK